MDVTQNYSRPSRASMGDDGGLQLDIAAELSRPGVKLKARILDSLGYGRVMLALYNVVSSDLRSRQKDHTAYQKWVEQRYLEELTDVQGAKLRALPGLTVSKASLKERMKHLDAEIRPLEASINSGEFYSQRQKYFNWLYKNDMDAWWVLDPVVSVHPDCVVFEVFSLDESSYGRVTVPWEKLELLGDVRYGTTNVDYSSALLPARVNLRCRRGCHAEHRGRGARGEEDRPAAQLGAWLSPGAVRGGLSGD